MKPLILCLGNEVLSDDGFGHVVAERLMADRQVLQRADVVAAAVAGFSLLDLLAGRECVLVVDTIRSEDHEAGRLRLFPAGELTPSRGLTTSHQISLPTALQLGKLLGAKMPDVVNVLAVEAEDLETLREELTPAVAAAVEPAAEMVKRWVESVETDSR